MGQGPGLGRHLDFRKSEMEILAVRKMGRFHGEVVQVNPLHKKDYAK